MDNPIVYIVLVVLVLGAVIAVRVVRSHRAMDTALSEWCRDQGVPDIPFDLTTAARQVVAGTRPGIPRDGQWWVAMGIEQVGRPSATRLLDEDVEPNEDAVYDTIALLFDHHGGSATNFPHLAESHFVGRLTSVHGDIILARITGHHRPIGGWMVAVPPWSIGARREREQLRW